MSSAREYQWLVLGASGLVGSHIAAALRGRRFVVTSHRTQLPGALPLDLADRKDLEAVVSKVRPEVLVIAAANAHVERSEQAADATRRINVDAVRWISGAAPDALLVVFSSEYVFDGSAGSYREDDPVAPINEYGRQKVMLEAIAREHGPHLVCRVSGVYGWSAARTNFVCQLVDRLRSGKRFTVPADQLITPTPAADLGATVVELVERGARGTFHAAGPEIVLRPVFAQQAAIAFGLDPRSLDFVPTTQLGLLAPRPLAAGLVTQKLRSFLGHGLGSPLEGLEAMRAAEAAL